MDSEAYELDLERRWEGSATVDELKKETKETLAISAQRLEEWRNGEGRTLNKEELKEIIEETQGRIKHLATEVEKYKKDRNAAKKELEGVEEKLAQLEGVDVPTLQLMDILRDKLAMYRISIKSRIADIKIKENRIKYCRDFIRAL